MNLFSRVKRKLCWTIFSKLPKKQNKIVFESYYGRGFSDNPKAIAQELINQGGYDMYWAVKDENEAKSLPHCIKPIKQNTLKSIYHFCTAGFWVDNCRKGSYVRKSKKQYYIQCWHGFPLKRIEKDAGDSLEPHYVVSAKMDSAIIDVMLSNSSFLTDIYHSAFWYNGEVLEGGFPRNDILVKGNHSVKDKVYKAFNLEPDTKIMLYAPTYRKDMELSVYDVDYASCISALEESLSGKWIIFARLHPNIASKSHELGLDSRYVLDASSYPDIQEIYVASAAMLSDYSSVMFDYIATGKPCFLYVNDLKNYKDDRNFYFDIGKLPFSLAENNLELTKNIKNFDITLQREKAQDFCKEFGIVESGNSARQIADRINEIRGTVK